jgi:hypothetical protein
VGQECLRNLLRHAPKPPHPNEARRPLASAADATGRHADKHLEQYMHAKRAIQSRARRLWAAGGGVREGWAWLPLGLGSPFLILACISYVFLYYRPPLAPETRFSRVCASHGLTARGAALCVSTQGDMARLFSVVLGASCLMGGLAFMPAMPSKVASRSGTDAHDGFDGLGGVHGGSVYAWLPLVVNKKWCMG